MHEVLESTLEQVKVAPSFVATSTVEETFSAAPSLEMSGAIRDEISKLVQKLFLGAQGPRRVVFAGTEPGSGSSWTCARVAEALASQGRGSVCVVDCNLRTPGLHQQFASENHHGLSDALAGSGSIREYAHRWSRTLWLLSCGSSAEAGVAMLASDRMRSLLTEMRTAFDYVLIDAPALSTCNDAILLGGLSDGVVVVLKANTSRRETARKAVQDLHAANVRVLGAVLNQRTFPIPEAIYKKL